LVSISFVFLSISFPLHSSHVFIPVPKAALSVSRHESPTAAGSNCHSGWWRRGVSHSAGVLYRPYIECRPRVQRIRLSCSQSSYTGTRNFEEQNYEDTTAEVMTKHYLPSYLSNNKLTQLP
jgi:hypothetical protein